MKRVKNAILGPTRTLLLDEPLEEVIAKLAAWCDSDACPFETSHRGAHFQLVVPKEQRKIWSAYLTVEVREIETEQGVRTEVFGRFNPSPNVWTMFMLTTIACFTVFLGAIAWGGAELMLDKPPHALWFAPGSVLFAALLWTASGLGQHLARHEMDELWDGAMRATGSAGV